MGIHIFKPGDMAMVTVCATAPEVVGMYCFVDSHPYAQKMRRPDGTTYSISIVDITIGHPIIHMANIECLKYIPPDEWPESVFKERMLVRVEGDSHGTQEHRPKKQREPETTESVRI